MEFALILPVLLLLILGMIEFGYAFTVYTGMFNAAREGARYGVINPSDVPGITSRVTSKISIGDATAVDIRVSYDGGPGTTVFTDTGRIQIGDRVLIHLTYDLPTLTPVIQPIIRTLHIETQAARTITTLGSGNTIPIGDLAAGATAPSTVNENITTTTTSTATAMGTYPRGGR